MDLICGCLHTIDEKKCVFMVNMMTVEKTSFVLHTPFEALKHDIGSTTGTNMGSWIYLMLRFHFLLPEIIDSVHL